jgi:hypothetical protein
MIDDLVIEACPESSIINHSILNHENLKAMAVDTSDGRLATIDD